MGDIMSMKKCPGMRGGGDMKGALKGELAAVTVRWQQAEMLGAVPEFARRGEASQGHKMCKKTCVHKKNIFVFILQSESRYTSWIFLQHVPEFVFWVQFSAEKENKGGFSSNHLCTKLV